MISLAEVEIVSLLGFDLPSCDKRKSELIPNRERVRIFGLRDRNCALKSKPRGYEGPLGFLLCIQLIRRHLHFVWAQITYFIRQFPIR